MKRIIAVGEGGINEDGEKEETAYRGGGFDSDSDSRLHTYREHAAP